MSTRSLISVEQEDGKVKTIYCHFDGYPSNNGKILFENYDTFEKANELVDLGDMSSLGDTPKNTEYYSRDRGEKLNITISLSVSQALKGDAGHDYHYTFKNGEWYIGHREPLRKLKELFQPEE